MPGREGHTGKLEVSQEAERARGKQGQEPSLQVFMGKDE